MSLVMNVIVLIQLEYSRRVGNIYDVLYVKQRGIDGRIEMKRPTIICLCGSTRFKKEWEQANIEETLKGKIVLSVSSFTHADKLKLSKGDKIFLDKLYFKKIKLADEILVINPNGYIGESTMNEIEHAKVLCKPVKYMFGWNDYEWIKEDD